MIKIVYFSLTGQTRRFIKKVDLPAYEITTETSLHEINEPYLLVVPTYEPDVLIVVDDFLKYKSNAQNIRGVAGGGNRNFADLFIYTAKNIAKEYQIPLVFAFEFNGTTEDVTNFRKVVMNFES